MLGAGLGRPEGSQGRLSQEMVRPRRSRAAARSMVGESARPRHRGDQEGRRPGAPRPVGSAGAGPSPVPPADLHVLLLEDLLVLLQKQDEKLLLKCHSKTAAGASDGKQTFSPVLKLNAVLVRSVATGAGRGRAHPPRPGPWSLAVVSSRPGAVWGRPGVPQDFPGHLRPSPVPAYLSRRRGTSWAKTDGLVQPGRGVSPQGGPGSGRTGSHLNVRIFSQSEGHFCDIKKYHIILLVFKLKKFNSI